jgi:hypothetical protein
MHHDEDCEADILVSRPLRPSDVSEVFYRWGSFLVALGLLVYAALLISS